MTLSDLKLLVTILGLTCLIFVVVGVCVQRVRLVVVLAEAKLLIPIILVVEHKFQSVFWVFILLSIRLHYRRIIVHRFLLSRFELCVMEVEDRNQRRQIPDQVEDVLKQHLFE